MLKCLLIIFTAFFILCGRKMHEKTAAPKLCPAPIDSIRIVQKPHGKEILLEIYGQLPSPAYALEHMEVNRKGNSVVVKPLLSYDREKIVIMMTVPFRHTVTLPAEEDAELYIQVIGAGNSLTKVVTNKARERSIDAGRGQDVSTDR